MMQLRCSRCNNSKFWHLRNNRLRCVRCRYTFTRKKRNISLLKKIIQEFLLEHSTNIILARVKISKYQLLKILTLLRIVMTKDIPEVFEGIVEVDEAYLGGK